MFVVLSGEVRLSVRGTVLETVKSGDVFGEMALIDAEPRSATAVAAGECRVALVDEQRFNFLVQQTPFFALYLMRLLVRRLRQMDDTLS